MKNLQDPWFHTKEQGTEAAQEGRHNPETEENPITTDNTDQSVIP